MCPTPRSPRPPVLAIPERTCACLSPVECPPPPQLVASLPLTTSSPSPCTPLALASLSHDRSHDRSHSQSRSLSLTLARALSCALAHSPTPSTTHARTHARTAHHPLQSRPTAASRAAPRRVRRARRAIVPTSTKQDAPRKRSSSCAKVRAGPHHATWDPFGVVCLAVLARQDGVYE